MEAMFAIFGGFMAAFLIPAMLMDVTPRIAAVSLAVVMLLAGGYAIYLTDSFQTRYWQWSLPEFPSDEKAFVDAASTLHELRLEATTVSDRPTALREAAARLCALPPVVSNWIGRVDLVYPTGTGNDISLAVRIWPQLRVRTALFPDNTDTLIRGGSPVASQAADLRHGDIVRFSGSFVSHAGACVGDPPMSSDEQQRDPEFVFRFSSVAKQAS